MNKYKNKPTEVDGMVFPSRREANRYAELKLLQRTGRIKALRTQVPFELIEAQRSPPTRLASGKSRPGRVLERAVVYVADFVYEEDGETVVEDAKGVRTKDYIIKRKLMLLKYGVRIREV